MRLSICVLSINISIFFFVYKYIHFHEDSTDSTTSMTMSDELQANPGRSTRLAANHFELYALTKNMSAQKYIKIINVHKDRLHINYMCGTVIAWT